MQACFAIGYQDLVAISSAGLEWVCINEHVFSAFLSAGTAKIFAKP